LIKRVSLQKREVQRRADHIRKTISPRVSSIYLVTPKVIVIRVCAENSTETFEETENSAKHGAGMHICLCVCTLSRYAKGDCHSCKVVVVLVPI